MKSVFLSFVGAASLLAAVPASSHHSFAAEFDINRPVKLTGTVTKLEWTNPHAWIFIDAKDDNGNVQNWARRARRYQRFAAARLGARPSEAGRRDQRRRVRREERHQYRERSVGALWRARASSLGERAAREPEGDGVETALTRVCVAFERVGHARIGVIRVDHLHDPSRGATRTALAADSVVGHRGRLSHARTIYAVDSTGHCNTIPLRRRCCYAVDDSVRARAGRTKSGDVGSRDRLLVRSRRALGTTSANDPRGRGPLAAEWRRGRDGVERAVCS